MSQHSLVSYAHLPVNLVRSTRWVSLDSVFTVESASDKIQILKVEHHAENATPIYDRGKILEIFKIANFRCSSYD